MTPVPRYRDVDEYLEHVERWHAELTRLREILAPLDLEETIKWGAPCYTHAGRNVVGMLGFKAYFGLWFHEGAALSDPLGVLINAQEGKTKDLRQWRFTSARELRVRDIKSYLKAAIAVAAERAAAPSAPPAKRAAVTGTVPCPELDAALAANAKARTAFRLLTPGRQREYAAFIAEPKRAETRARRLAKAMPLIEAGQGLNDRYR